MKDGHIQFLMYCNLGEMDHNLDANITMGELEMSMRSIQLQESDDDSVDMNDSFMVSTIQLKKYNVQEMFVHIQRI